MNKYLLSLFLILPLIIVSIWFRQGKMIASGEDSISLYNPSRMVQLSSSTWNEINTGFSNFSLISDYPYFETAKIVLDLEIPPFVFQAAVFYLLMVIACLGMFFLVSQIIKEDKNKFKIATIAALFYLLNPFSMSQVWGRGIHNIFFGFALLPLASFLFYKGLYEKKYFLLIPFVLVTLLLSSAFSIFTYVLVFWSVISLIFLSFIILNLKNKSSLIYGFLFYISCLIIWILAHFWWFLPLFSFANKVYSGETLHSNENIGTLLGLSPFFTLNFLIRLQQKYLFYTPGSFGPIFSNIIFQVLSYLSAIAFIYGLYKAKSKQYLSMFLVLGVGLFICLGANPPFGDSFVWLFERVSFLQAFRNPYEKYGIVLTLAYTFFFAYGLYYLGEFLNKKYNFSKKYFTYLFLFIVCGVLAWPMWTGKVVSSPNGEIGIDVPNYYQETLNYLKDNNGDYRLFLSPFLGGDGIVQNWDGRRFNGTDPSLFIFNDPTISFLSRLPYGVDIMTYFRNFISQENVVPVFSLLRAKYLVERDDVIEVKQEHEKYLTDKILVPTEMEDNTQTICNDLSKNLSGQENKWLGCTLKESESNWGQSKYLHLNVKTDLPSHLEIAIRDKQGNRSRWDGRDEFQYRTLDNQFREIIIPLTTGTEFKENTDFSNIELIEVLPHPAVKSNQISKIEIQNVWLDLGSEKKQDEFNLEKVFGKIKIYSPKNFNPPDEVDNLTKLAVVKDVSELFKIARERREELDHLGILLSDHNKDKNLDNIKNLENSNQIKVKKFNEMKFLIETENEDKLFLLLSKNFNPQWKLIPIKNEKLLDGTLNNNLELIDQTPIEESQKYVVNGYANLWIIDKPVKKYALVFMPQLYKDIGADISKITAGVLLIIGLIILGVKTFRKTKTKTK